MFDFSPQDGVHRALSCVLRRRNFAKALLSNENGEYSFAMFCEVFSEVYEQTDKLSVVLETVQRRAVG